MLPGFSSNLMPKGNEKENQEKIKRYISMMDSMTDKELDSMDPKIITPSRIVRIARGASRRVKEVVEMIEEYKQLTKTWGKMRGLSIPGNGDMSRVLHGVRGLF